MNDTIVAISSAVGDGAISIIRLSGDEAISIVDKVVTTSLANKKTHTINYGYVKHGKKIIDEVLIAIMRAPKTYTKEDVVEIYCHGGYAVTNAVFEIILNAGAKLAEPGEFTKRAFLNGRIDLVQAESVGDLINASTEMSRQVAVNNLRKGVSNRIVELRENILKIIANVEVNIDYPEYDEVEQLTSTIIKPSIERIESDIKRLIADSRDGKIISEGLSMSIIGSPNVGKSSLLNLLLEEEKAIVTDIAGTTRDAISSQIILGGVLFNLTDTAGIRKTDDVVESIGVKKSLEHLVESDFVLFVIDANKKLSNEEIELLEFLKNKPHVLVINKIDLENRMDYDVSEFNTVELSVKEGINIGALESKIKDVLGLNNLKVKDQTFVTKTRHINHLNQALNSIVDIKTGIENGIEIDMLSVDINNVYYELGSILGQNSSDDILDRLFSDFCLGK